MNFFWLVARLSLLLCITITGAQDAAKRPNIVFILTDDQDMRMHSLSHMPKVQNLLILEGTAYSRHYAPTALCCPARVSITTGLYAHNHLVTDVDGPFGGWHHVLNQGLDENYLPIWLKQGGYRTYYVGKLYNGMREKMVEKKTAKGWTEADLLVGNHTYQYYAPSFQHIEGDWNNPEKVKIYYNNYTTHQVAEYAYGYLREAVKHDEPFFVGIAPITPHSQVGKDHSPPVPAKKYAGTRSDAKIPRAENFNPSNRSGVNFVWELDKLSEEIVGQLQYHYRCRTEALLSVDDLVEGVIDILKKANQLDNTYIIYSSDNGFHLGHHRLGAGKKCAFEEDINVPLIIRRPGVPKGKKIDIVTTHVDLAPTILDMAGIAQHKYFDGKVIPYTQAAISNADGAGADEHTSVEGWTGAKYKYQKNLKGKKHVNSYKSLRLIGKGYDIMYAVQCHKNAHELYNMNKDPGQMRNLHPTAPAESGHKNPFHSGENQLAGYDIERLLTRVDALLLVLKSCKGNACVKPWKELHHDGNVNNLRDAMNQTFEDKYSKLHKHKKWNPNDLEGDLGTFEVETDRHETAQVVLGTEGDEEPVQGWESPLGYWDDDDDWE